MYGENVFEEANASIWASTSMLLDNCEHAVSQLRTVRQILENDSDEAWSTSTNASAAYAGHPATAADSRLVAKRRWEEDLSPTPVVQARSARPAGGREHTKRVRILAQETLPAESTPLRGRPVRRPPTPNPRYDPFVCNETKPPEILISSDSD